MKRFWVAILVFAFASIGLYQPIAESFCGLIARAAIAWKFDSRLAWRKLDWERGRIVFSDPVLLDETFHLHAKRASFVWDWRSFPGKFKGHLSIEAPHIVFSELKKWEWGGDWVELTAEVKEGWVEWPDMERASFALDVGEEAILDLRWKEAEAHVAIWKEEVEGHFSHIPAETLDAWARFYFPEWRGAWLYAGKVSGLFSGNGREGNCHLEVDRVGCAFSSCEVTEATGTLDWEGPFSKGEPLPILRDLCPVSSEGRLRLAVAHLNLVSSAGNVQDLRGDFSFRPGLGAKWRMDGTALAQETPLPFAWEGKG